jgi:hypothetical protein
MRLRQVRDAVERVPTVTGVFLKAFAFIREYWFAVPT